MLKMPLPSLELSALFDRIYRGSMPMLVVNEGLSVEDYYGSYMQTYLERDIRDLIR